MLRTCPSTRVVTTLAMHKLAQRAFGRAACAPVQHSARQRNLKTRVQAKFVEDDEDLEEAVAQFLAQQDISERGIQGSVNPNKIVGQDEVDEETAKAYSRDIIRVLRILKEGRDMDFNEVKLIVQVDDPRNDDIRKMGMEDSSGVSRDEMAIALQQVADGQLPTDRLALKVLHAEITNWPFLEVGTSPEQPRKLEASSLGSVLEANAVASGLATADSTPLPLANQPKGLIGRDPKDRPQGIQDTLPEWMGYGAIYFFTIIPVLIFGGTVAILFFSSLK